MRSADDQPDGEKQVHGQWHRNPSSSEAKCATPCHVAFSDLCSSLTQLWLCGGDLGWKKAREERGLGKQSMGKCVGLIPLKWCLREPGNLGTVLETSLEPSIAGPVGGFLCSAITSISPTWSIPYLFARPCLRSPGVLFYFPLMGYGILM